MIFLSGSGEVNSKICREIRRQAFGRHLRPSFEMLSASRGGRAAALLLLVGMAERSFLGADAQKWGDVSTLWTAGDLDSLWSVSIKHDDSAAATIRWRSPTGPYSITVLDLQGATISERTLVGPTSAAFDDGSATFAKFNAPMGLSYSHDGKWLAVADKNNHCIRRVDTETGNVETLAGSPPPYSQQGYRDGPSASARFRNPTSVAFVPAGPGSGRGSSWLVVGDSGNNVIRKINLLASSLEVTTLAGVQHDNNAPHPQGWMWNDGPASEAVFYLGEPAGLAVDPQKDAAGNVRVLVADEFNDAVREIVVGSESNTGVSVRTVVGYLCQVIRVHTFA